MSHNLATTKLRQPDLGCFHKAKKNNNYKILLLWCVPTCKQINRIVSFEDNNDSKSNS